MPGMTDPDYDLPSHEGGWTVRDLALSWSEGGPSMAQRARILKEYGLLRRAPANENPTPREQVRDMLEASVAQLEDR